jgi:hypothetical protein
MLMLNEIIKTHAHTTKDGVLNLRVGLLGTETLPASAV